MKKTLILCLLVTLVLVNAPAFAGQKESKGSYTHGVNGKVTPKTVGAGALSLIIWPGIGQLMNDDSTDKAATHAIIGFFPPFRIWSCYDAVVNRKGGVWDNRI